MAPMGNWALWCDVSSRIFKGTALVWSRMDAVEGKWIGGSGVVVIVIGRKWLA